ncbi:hypothetical protein BGW37DRAFT_451581 [Umbelopsis sp. PMI_123]|nr:hypothetical protein BGW37DRAFT_451581 [Umbelopsis sp. PMI_123]
MAAKSNRYSTMPSNEAENIDGGYQAQLSAEEQVDYPKLFKIANKSGSGIVSGAEAIEFFAKSGLSPNVLSEIWDIADEANVGSLDAQAFYVALKLIACRQQGKEISKPVLSTRVKVPVFDGVSIGAAPDAGKPIIQQAEREKFIRIFHASRPENGILDSEKAKRVFSRSQLPVDTLAQIWSLADSRRSGTLNQTEFVIAMYYIARCMEGKKDIPSTLPSTVYAAAAGRAPSTSPSPQISHSVAPAPRQNTVPQPMASSPIQPIARQFTGASSANKWTISPEDRRKYDGFFDKIDVGKLGYIQGADAVEFFQNSRLPDSDLAHIWDLADRHERGRLSKEEFAIAMYLIHKRLKGDVLPTILPPSLLAQTQASSQPVTGSSTFVQSPPSTDHSLIDDGDHFHQFETRTTVAQANSELDTLRQNVKLGEEQQTGLNAERTSLDEQLNSIQKERAELSDRLSTLNRSQAEAKAAIAKLKDQMEVEREELRKAQDDAKRVTEELEALQAQKQEVNTEIESNRSESTRLKKSIYAKQEQSNHLRRELEKLGAFIKKDRMMLDITRRQASATDSDVAKLETALDKAKSGAPIEDVTDALPASPKLSQQPSTPSTPTESNSSGAPVRLAAEQSSHDDFSNSDPFDDFTRTFEAAKESTTASDFDEVFGEQATSPFAPFSEQQSFASGFDDDFAVPTSTQSLLTGKSDDTMKNDVAQETPAVKGVDSAPETIATPEVPAASAPQKQPDDSGPDDTESDSQSESSTDSESSEEDEDEDEKEADDKKSPVTEAAEPTSATAATSVDAANVSSVEESTTEPTNDRHQITTHQPEEPIIEDQKDERVESEPADTTEKQDQSATFDTSFEDDFNPTFEQPQKDSPLVNEDVKDSLGDGLQELLNMGFSREQAIDALRRYDNDLEKATNFLLDF